MDRVAGYGDVPLPGFRNCITAYHLVDKLSVDQTGFSIAGSMAMAVDYSTFCITCLYC